MSSAMQYRVIHDHPALTPRARFGSSLRAARQFVEVVVARGAHTARIEWREPGGVWQTLTEGAGEVGEVPRLAEGRERGFESRPPSVSVPSVPQVPVGEHECVTCTRCACTYAAAHPACPRCSEAGRSVPSVPEVADIVRITGGRGYGGKTP